MGLYSLLCQHLNQRRGPILSVIGVNEQTYISCERLLAYNYQNQVQYYIVITFYFTTKFLSLYLYIYMYIYIYICVVSTKKLLFILQSVVLIKKLNWDHFSNPFQDLKMVIFHRHLIFQNMQFQSIV